MDEYQVRTWQGWHHHMALSLIAVWFLIGRPTGAAADACLDSAAGPIQAEPAPAGGIVHAWRGLHLPSSPASIGIGRSLAAPPPTPPGIRVRTKAVRCGYLLW